MVSDERDHLYIVQLIVTGETRNVRKARGLMYNDEQLRFTSRVQEVFNTREMKQNTIYG